MTTVNDAADKAARYAAPWIEWIARLGYFSKGVVYAIIGYFAFLAAFGNGDTQDSGEAFGTILRQPFGTVLLILVAIGLAGYAAWRILQGILDPERKGKGAKGIGWRLAVSGRGIFHLWLAWSAFRLATGGPPDDGDETERWTARLMDQPFGVWLVALVGAGVGIYGLHQIWKGASGNIGKHIRMALVPAPRRKWLVRASRYGLAARGVIFTIAGIFLVRAAMQDDASEAKGLEEALQTIATTPYGTALLALVGLGLFAYGIHEFIKARYRRVEVT